MDKSPWSVQCSLHGRHGKLGGDLHYIFESTVKLSVSLVKKLVDAESVESMHDAVK